MTRAPKNLLAVRTLLLTHLNVDKDTVRVADLEPGEVGVVGDAKHRGGYHCGRDRVVAGDYSVVESSRDRNGLTDDASALDVGMFEVHSGGRTHTLRTFSIWCVGQCIANAPDTRDIREIIYSPDGKVVKRWDRLGKRTTGDKSHLTHTHFSFFRDAIKAGRDQTPLYRRYLTSIGLLEAAPTSEDDMAMAWTDNWPGRNGGRENAAQRLAMAAHGAQDALEAIKSLRVAVTALAESRPGVATEEIIARMNALAEEERQRDAEQVAVLLARLTPEAIAAAIPPELADQVVDKLAARLAASPTT